MNVPDINLGVIQYIQLASFLGAIAFALWINNRERAKHSAIPSYRWGYFFGMAGLLIGLSLFAELLMFAHKAQHFSQTFKVLLAIFLSLTIIIFPSILARRRWPWIVSLVILSLVCLRLYRTTGGLATLPFLALLFFNAVYMMTHWKELGRKATWRAKVSNHSGP